MQEGGLQPQHLS